MAVEIVQRTRAFGVSPDSSPHQSTSGYTLPSLVQRLAVAVYSVVYDWFYFGVGTPPPSSPLRERVKRISALTTTQTFIDVMGPIQERAQGSAVQMIGLGDLSGGELGRGAPSSVLGGRYQEREEDSWSLIDYKAPSLEKSKILYPLVLPSRGLLSVPHIVLIGVDREEKRVYYYDSTGLTSDDPSWRGVFSDAPEFNLHDDLVDLAQRLFGEEGTVIENTAAHQMSPYACGKFVLSAIRSLMEGDSWEEAFGRNASETAATLGRSLGEL